MGFAIANCIQAGWTRQDPFCSAGSDDGLLNMTASNSASGWPIRRPSTTWALPNPDTLSDRLKNIRFEKATARGTCMRHCVHTDSTDWPTMLPEANGIMNNRRNAALSYVSPADLLDAFQDGDTAVVNKALSTLPLHPAPVVTPLGLTKRCQNGVAPAAPRCS